jgi:hypothetical protein
MANNQTFIEVSFQFFGDGASVNYTFHLPKIPLVILTNSNTFLPGFNLFSAVGAQILTSTPVITSSSYTNDGTLTVQFSTPPVTGFGNQLGILLLYNI